MEYSLTLSLLPENIATDEALLKEIQKQHPKKNESVTGFKILKKSIDARGQKIKFLYRISYFTDTENSSDSPVVFIPVDISEAKKKVIIIGAGPAGLFAALQLILHGIQPIILERGKDVRSRRRDLAKLNKEGIVNKESNYCFGEGGAGTYSDGKLYTRSKKRGDLETILKLFVQFGAPENILYDAHPHIGTNKLPQIITAMREAILACGGKFLFEQQVDKLNIKENSLIEVGTTNGESFMADAYLLATGHSARDIFELLYKENILLEAKPFALGVRVEHPQKLIDAIQYHIPELKESDGIRPAYLPPASYSLVQQWNNRGVFSFCMCPGGIIAPAATDPGELVVNGWSPSKRNNKFANSGMVVQVEKEEAYKWLNEFYPEWKLTPDHPLLMMKFQQAVEQRSYEAGGGKFVAPAQRLLDFIKNKPSADLPENSYLPGLKPALLSTVLPSFIYKALADSFKIFGKKLKGYLTNEAVLVATESRTSSPVRIPRTEDLHHPEIKNLYPCGEGAGYAGGIVSAAMDGMRVANQISLVLLKKV